MAAKILKSLVCIVFLVAPILAAAQNGKPQPFSSDLAVISPKNEKLMTGKLYFAPPKVRMDMHDVQNNVAMSTIIDYEEKVAIAMLPQFHTYTEVSMDQKTESLDKALPAGALFDSSNPCADHASWKCQKTGIDTLNGRKCDVWEITTNGPPPGTAWVDQKLNFPIKYRQADGTTLEYSNIHEGQPDASLFQIPSGYQKSATQVGQPQPKK
jgi:hypothetical protein